MAGKRYTNEIYLAGGIYISYIPFFLQYIETPKNIEAAQYMATFVFFVPSIGGQTSGSTSGRSTAGQ